LITLIKIVVIGDEGVGKEQLFQKEKEIQGSFLKTHGFQPYTIVKHIEDRVIRFQSWLLNPLDKFKEDRQTYYNGAMGALIIFDVNNVETFNSVDKWIHEIWKGAGNDIPIVIMGNRPKNIEEDMKTTSMVYEYLKQLMMDEKEGILRMIYVENSLQDNQGYEEALQQLGLEYFYYLERKNERI
jgi:GTPase SAR1 family protein